MPKSVLEAVKLGLWDFEPTEVENHAYAFTEAMPGTKEKLEVLADRVQNGLPLWHPLDRDDAEDSSPRVGKPR